MTILFSTVLAAIHRADRTRCAGDIICAAVMLDAYVQQLAREQRRHGRLFN